MKLKDGRISILADKGGVKIELYDLTAGRTFAVISLTPEQFTQALSRLMYTECEIALHNLDIVGKTMKMDRLTFELPTGTDYKNRTDIAVKLAIEKCPEGWEPDLYFNSQESFFTKDDKNYARTVIRKWE